MATHPIIDIVNGKPVFKATREEIWSECKKGGAFKILSPAELITEGQRNWWKGILLKKLAEDTGDSVQYWESTLKLEVMPDVFALHYIPHGKQVIGIIPPITILSMKKMNELMEGSVAHLHETKYGDKFLWVTMPDADLRKNKL